MPASQPVIMSQPMPMMPGRDVRKMMFSQEGRDWTTGLCGCFENVGSCKTIFFISSVGHLILEEQYSNHDNNSKQRCRPNADILCGRPTICYYVFFHCNAQRNPNPYPDFLS